MKTAICIERLPAGVKAARWVVTTHWIRWYRSKKQSRNEVFATRSKAIKRAKEIQAESPKGFAYFFILISVHFEI